MVGFLNLVENGKTAVLNLVEKLTDASNVLIIGKFEVSKKNIWQLIFLFYEQVKFLRYGAERRQSNLLEGFYKGFQ